MSLTSQIIVAVLFFVCLIAAIIGGGNLFQRQKIKKRIKQDWGKKTYQGRYDKESSLKEAWNYAKSYQQFDSEVDDITWDDLDLFEVFQRINATYSSVGSEALYQRLRNFNFDEKTSDNADLEELISFYHKNPALRELTQFRFAQLGKQDQNSTKSYISSGEREAIPRFYTYLALGLLPIAAIILLLFHVLWAVFILIGSIFFNMIYYYSQKGKLEVQLNAMRYLVMTLSTARAISKLSTPLQADLKANFSPFRAVLYFGFSFRVQSYSETDVILDFVNAFFMIPFMAYNLVLKRLSQHQKEAIELWNRLGEMEVAISILNFRLLMGQTTVPIFREGGVRASETYHPLLGAAAVTNPIDWQRNTLVTGSNASGKSTYVKSIAINCILAQSIHTACAEHFEMAHGHVLTSMAARDNIIAGDSYFVAEIKSIKRVLDQVEKGERCYCFIDEILKGTNTIERISASSSVINWLQAYPSLAFVATHDIELPEILKNDCDNVHFEEQVKDEGISFDYQLRQGRSQSRNALRMLQVLDYPEAIIDRAQKEAEFFDKERSWRVYDD